MIFPRASAVVFLLLLTGAFLFAGITGVVWLGTLNIQGTNIMHADGKVIQVGPGKDFVLELETGQ